MKHLAGHVTTALIMFGALVPVAAHLACSSPGGEGGKEVRSVQQAQDWDPETDLSFDCEISETPDTLEQFAEKCDLAIGDTVPAFDCDQGSLVDEGNETGSYPNGFCDRPNVLRGECDPGSRFQRLPSSNPDVLTVAHCRKQGLGAG
jgi:hypothetical protein